MAKPILEGLTVVEIGSGRSCALAGMLLADNGARVLKLEAPGGDPLRKTFPSAFHVWNRGKESVETDLRSPDGQEQARTLLSTSDVAIEGLDSGTAASWNLGAQTLLEQNPRLVFCSIKGFPQNSPYATMKGYEGIVAAKSGIFAPSTLRPGPNYSNFQEGSLAAGYLAVQGILGALLVRLQTGQGQYVESTLYQGYFAYDIAQMIQWHLEHRRPDLNPSPSSSAPVPNLMSECLSTRDGRWVEFMNILPHQFAAYIRALGMEHLWNETGFERAPIVAETDVERYRDMFFARFRERSLAEWMPTLSAEANLAFEPVLTIEESMDHPQVIHNRASIEVNDPELGKMRQAAFPAVFGRTPVVEGKGAPRLGEHRELSRLDEGEVASWHNGDAAPGRTGKPEFPLSGVVIVELATNMATPYSLTILSTLGARVIKVETLDGDPWRRMNNGVYGVQTVQGKESIAIDLSQPEGRALLHDLVRRADVFVNGFRPGAEKSLDVEYETLKALNPRLIYVFGAGYGSSGPASRQPMYGNVTKAMMGGVYRQAGRWLDPERAKGETIDQLKEHVNRFRSSTPAGGDPESALGRATVIMLALLEQRRSGIGQFIDTSMVNLNAFANAEDFVKWSGKPPMAVPDVDGFGLNALYRLYPTSDGWVFLAAPSQGEWQRFARAVAPEMLEDPRFVSSRSRVVYEDDLAGAIEKVLTTREGSHWQQLLTKERVACVKVYEGGTFGDFSCTDPGIAAAGLVTDVPSARFGVYPRHGAFVTFAEHQAAMGGPPEVGEQSEAILLDLGYSKERIAELATMGTVGFWPETPKLASEIA